MTVSTLIAALLLPLGPALALGPTFPDAAATVAASDQTERSQARDAAARALRSGIANASEGRGVAPWVEAARAAAAELGPGPFTATLDEAVLDARWRATVDPALAAERLERELRTALVDLEFVPLLAAQLPENFPAPTPVRHIELKWVPAHRVAVAAVHATDPTRAHQSLLAHLQRSELPLRSPVVTTYALGDGPLRAKAVAFLLPTSGTGSTASGSSGASGEVEVFDAEPRLVLSLGGRGRLTPEHLADARRRLLERLASEDAWVVDGALRSAFYEAAGDDDWSSAYEVKLPVRPAGQDAGAALVLDLGSRDEVRRWSPVNDSVMGGISTSRITGSGVGTAIFEGNLSLENNGGFASIRRRPAELTLDGANALRLTFRGDGQQYRLRLRTNDSMGGVNYEVAFPTQDGVWRTQRFELDEFVANWRGRRVRDAESLTFEDVRSLGIQFSDKQVGAFHLELGALSIE